MRELESILLEKLPGRGVLALLQARYYAMDRDNRWERTERFWQALTMGVGDRLGTAQEVIDSNYAQGITDEFITPAIVAIARLSMAIALSVLTFAPIGLGKLAAA